MLSGRNLLCSVFDRFKEKDTVRSQYYISSPFDTGLENNLFPPSPTGLENYLTASPPKKTSLSSHLLLLLLYPTLLLRPPQVLWPHLSQLSTFEI